LQNYGAHQQPLASHKRARQALPAGPAGRRDAATLDPDDLLHTDQVYPDRIGEIYQLACICISAATILRTCAVTKPC
jgi:hypothetical protein